MPFLYFIPSSAQQVTPDDIERLGLGYAIDHPTSRGCTGPGHQRGFVMGSNPESLCRMDPQTQSWVAAPKLDGDGVPYYVGWEGDLPTAESLKREQIIAGQMISLVDGSRWTVPQLVNWQAGESVPVVWNTKLPICIDIDDHGNPCDGSVVPRYRDLFDTGLRVLARLAGSREETLTSNQAIRFAANCLGVNYRVSLLELSSKVLSCLSTDDAIRIIHAAVDWKGYQDALGNWAGRQGRPTTAMESGSAEPTPDSAPITAQPLAS